MGCRRFQFRCEGKRAKAPFHAAFLAFGNLRRDADFALKRVILPAAINAEGWQYGVAGCHAKAKAERLVRLEFAAGKIERHGKVTPVAGALEFPRTFDVRCRHVGIDGVEIRCEAAFAVINPDGTIEQHDVVEPDILQEGGTAQVFVRAQHPVHVACRIANKRYLRSEQFHTLNVELTVEQAPKLQ